jgi:hypothetical protein
MWASAAVIAAVMASIAQDHHSQPDPHQTLEGCHWDESAQVWAYPDGSLCRSTGEDPAVDGDGNPTCAHGRHAVASHRYGTTIITCVRWKDA